MDNTEIHYLTYDSDAVWEKMILAYVEVGGDILYPGDEKEMLLRGVQAVIIQALAGVDNALRMATLRYAVRDYLDLYGEGRNCERIEAAPARATVEITTNQNLKIETLKAGTPLTADGQMFYLLEKDVKLSGFKETLTADIVAQMAGIPGNALVKGTEMHLTTTHSGINKIVVKGDAKGGTDSETDDVYRERIRVAGLASVTTGPERQYEAVAKSVSTQIIDAHAKRIGDGKVGVYVLLASEEGKEALLQSILDALSARYVRPLTDYVSVFQATDVPYTLVVEYAADSMSTIADAVAAAVKDYQEWQDNTIGRAFNPDRLMAAVYQAGAMRVKWGTGSKFKTGDPVQYTPIGECERCKGTITVSPLRE